LASIPQLYRNLRRWTEIVAVLSKYGLADWLSRTNIEFIKDQIKNPDGEALARLTTNARIRLALTELGPTFIKLGQLLSTRADLVGIELADELSQLQTQTPHDDFQRIRAVMEEELGRSISEAFASFDETPLASASIGQVHSARLFDGRAVVVKVRHVGIEEKIDTDLEILNGLAQLAQRLEEFKRYQPVTLVKDMGKMMRRELDFQSEFRNLLHFRKIFRKDKRVEIPEPIAHLSTSKMLTMTCLQGEKLRDLRKPLGDQDSGTYEEFARLGASLYLKMIFDEGFYHADPHPGNILLLPNRRIGLLDFGMVGRVSERMREDIETMLVAIVNQDVSLLVSVIQRVGECPLELNEVALANDVTDFVSQYSTQTAASFDMSGALNDFLQIVRNYQITLPSEVSLLIKVLITLEGTGQLLAPQFSLMEIMKPLQRRLMIKRLSPARQMRRIRRFYMQMENLAERIPSKLGSIIEQVQMGRFDIHLDHRRLGPTVNRLVVGMMTSALFLGSSLMLSYQVPPLWFVSNEPDALRMSLLGLTGCIVSFLMGFRLLWAIRKSGNLDQSE
jgi:ubiquinone biosynthesis protein